MSITPLVVVFGIAAYLLRDKTVSRTREALHEWEPQDAWERESDYRGDLADFLRDELPETYVVEEHGLGRGRRDIRVENRESGVAVAIELKFRLSSSSEANRLLGQIIRYTSDVKALFVVLVDSDPNQLAEIEKLLEEKFEGDNVELIAFDME